MNKAIFIFVSLIIFLASCVKDADNLAPEIIVNLNGENLVDTLIAEAGEMLSFQIQISDNETIDSYRVFVEFKNKEDISICEVDSDWSFLEIQDICGDKEAEVEIDILIPDSVYGVYEFEFSSFDSNSNLRQERFLGIIGNREIPQISVLQTDSLISSCEHFIEDSENPEVEIETTALNGISSVEFFRLSMGSVELNSTFSVYNEAYLNQVFQLNELADSTEIDTILVKVTDSQNVSSWSQIELYK